MGFPNIISIEKSIIKHNNNSKMLWGLLIFYNNKLKSDKVKSAKVKSAKVKSVKYYTVKMSLSCFLLYFLLH
jgi:hypothetical protein